MKKIIIINSPLFENRDIKNNEDYLPPLGLGLIYSSLEKIYEVKFIDALSDNLGVNELIEILLKEEFNYVCINIFTTNFIKVKQLVEQVNKKINWIIGGISTKSLYKEIFKWKTLNQIDIVYGDGELIIKDLIDSTITEVPTDIYKNKRFYIISSESKYYVKEISNENLNRSIFNDYEPQINHYNELEVSIYTSRGCPYDCAYCVAAQSRNKELSRVRHKSVDSIIAELENIKQLNPNVVTIRILDDLFLSNIKSFLEAIHIFNIFSFNWRAMCHIQSIGNIDDKIIVDLEKSGCKELFIGIESGSLKILRKIHKTCDIDLIINSVKRLLINGINVKGYFICGFPNENQDDLEETLSLATQLKNLSNNNNIKFRNSTFQFRPYYGTELCDEIVTNFNIPYNFFLNNIKPSEEINAEIRNKTFNFDSGNYSSINDEILMQYIKKMNDLNE